MTEDEVIAFLDTVEPEHPVIGWGTEARPQSRPPFRSATPLTVRDVVAILNRFTHPKTE